MKKIILRLLLSWMVFASSGAVAGEGMWIPMLLQQFNIAQMQSMGFRLTAEDIYSLNHSSLKDAIVLFGQGCTGEIVSSEGLLLTNHHCGYGSIQGLSSLEHDYLADGFWAMKKSEELPVKGLTVTMLISMNEVTEQTLKGVTPDMTESARAALIAKNNAAIEKEAMKGNHYIARVRPFFSGNQFYLLVSEVFKDIRLVGAPPSSIGKFGGDTDNWMWPRHTGDFSVFRIYVGKDNLPADYSPENVPYHPRYFLPVSIKGYNRGDFTFVFGYPGTTREYLPARGVEYTAFKENPVRIALRRQRLDIIGAAMDTNRLIGIQYASKYAGIANYWKKMIGETRGIKQLDGITVKQEYEKQFMAWSAEDETRKMKFGGLLPAFEKAYDAYEPVAMGSVYLSEAAMAPEIIRMAGSYDNLIALCKKKGVTDEEIASEVKKRKDNVAGFFKNYNAAVDRKIMKAMLPVLQKNVSPEMQPSVFRLITEKYDGNTDHFVTDLYQRTLFADSSRLNRFLSSFSPSDSKKILRDPGYIYAKSVNDRMKALTGKELKPLQIRIDSLQRLYMAGQMEMQQDHHFYPDANSTLRVSYGKVDQYSPADGVTYHYFTTTEGILAKEDPEIYDYVVDPKLKELLTAHRFGRYADADGTLHVAFTASNHTTGGNSGSPVLNAEGQLIGLNFDRNWEGTMSDLMYDPSQCRNITLDIRYCLFIMDIYAGAGHLVDEMTLVK